MAEACCSELAITISYPTSTSGITVLLKHPKNTSKSAIIIGKKMCTPNVLVVNGIRALLERLMHPEGQ